MSEQRSDRFEIEPFEERGVFLHIRFDGEDRQTVVFVAQQDFDRLRDMAERDDVLSEQFSRELFQLIEHTGHDGQHELREEGVVELRNFLTQYDPSSTGVEQANGSS